jgi:cytochrome c oxidase subunit 4
MNRVTQGMTSKAFVALLVLTLTSFAVSYVHTGAFNVPIALAIAGFKAIIVVGAFMELVTEPFTVKASFVIGVVFVLLLVLLTTADVATRTTAPLLPPSLD